MVRQLTRSLHGVLKRFLVLSRVATCLPLALVASTLFSGCQYGNRREAGTALGSGIGALAGGMIGEQSGHLFGGALLGALAGGVTGGLIGHAEDMREQRDNAITYAQYLESTGQILTNSDVIRMVQSGISDEVIIGTIKSSLGKYDLSPDATIHLKACGTSDYVILAMQQVPKISSVSHARYTTSSGPTPVGFVVAPAPVMVLGRPHYHHGPYYYRGGW